MPAGQPTKYNPQYCEDVIEHMKKGKSIRSFAAECSVDEETVHNWIKKHPEFFGAVKEGREQAYKWWENQGMTGLWDSTTSEVSPDGTKTTSFSKINNRMFEMFMQNMFGWSRKIAADVETKNDDQSKTIEALKEEVRALINAKEQFDK